MELQSVKQRFNIIGNSPLLNRAIETAVQVAPTDLSVLITGESGTGKEVMPQIIHALSARKHNPYIAVNCGAIPEGTIDSELFGHEKGSFTGAHSDRKGYFEVANTGTIFLDEVAELPLQTQVRLLRVLETGEFMKVGSSKIQKTNVRIVAATNVDIPKAIQQNKFREDLYYRLNTVPIQIPPLRNRKDDIPILFRKFAVDFSEKYRMPSIKLNDSATQLLQNYHWNGNIRQLKNIAEQISIIEKERDVDAQTLLKYLPEAATSPLPALSKSASGSNDFSEREILYKILFDLKNDITDLKKLVAEIIQSNSTLPDDFENNTLVKKIYGNFEAPASTATSESDLYNSIPGTLQIGPVKSAAEESYFDDSEEFVEESLSLEDKELELIKKALQKYNGKRKHAAQELGISERTLYRKIKEFNLK